MTRAPQSAVLALCLAAGLVAPGLRAADPAVEVHELFQNAAGALSDGKVDAFLSAFDSSLPGYAKLRAGTAQLVRVADTQSTIEWERNEGDGPVRSVQLNWLLDITERNGSAALTHRRAKVECRLQKKGEVWRIVSFTPADFFAPPQAQDAWQLLASAAAGLTEAVTETSSNVSDTPSANTQKFMDAFDPAMSGYAKLRENVLGLEQGGDVESSVDLVKNEGDDRRRTVQVDWSLNLISRDTTVSAMRRHESVTCTVEKQGKNWRITALEPRTLFAR
jgi:hypothetical protein